MIVRTHKTEQSHHDILLPPIGRVSLAISIIHHTAHPRVETVKT